MTSLVLLDSDRSVRTLTLNRPERLNALGPQLREALAEAVAETAELDAKIVVIQGAGRAFSAGADLKEPAERKDTWQERRREAGKWGRLLDAVEALPQVTIASMHGPVIGGAFLLAAACDFRVATPDTKLSIPELALGIPLTWGGVPRLVREVGLPRARELILTGRTLSADEALDWGFVHRVGDREQETNKLIEELDAMPHAPLAMSKEALNAYGRTLVSHEAAWADADLLYGAGNEEESRQAARDYMERLRKQ